MESAGTRSSGLPEVKHVQSYLCPESAARLPLGAPVQRCFPKTLLSVFKSSAPTNLTQWREGRFLAWLSLLYKEGKTLKALLNDVRKLPKVLFPLNKWLLKSKINHMPRSPTAPYLLPASSFPPARCPRARPQPHYSLSSKGMVQNIFP